MNEVPVVSERMLTRETETIRTDSAFLENFALLVIAGESIVDSGKGRFSHDVATDEVAKIQKGAEGAQHLGRNMTFDSGEVNLKLK